jgi:hypothetical protein
MLGVSVIQHSRGVAQDCVACITIYSIVETLGQKPAHTLHQISDYNIVMVKSLDGFQQGSNVKL